MVTKRGEWNIWQWEKPIGRTLRKKSVLSAALGGVLDGLKGMRPLFGGAGALGITVM